MNFCRVQRTKHKSEQITEEEKKFNRLVVWYNKEFDKLQNTWDRRVAYTEKKLEEIEGQCSQLEIEHSGKKYNINNISDILNQIYRIASFEGDLKEHYNIKYDFSITGLKSIARDMGQHALYTRTGIIKELLSIYSKKKEDDIRLLNQDFETFQKIDNDVAEIQNKINKEEFCASKDIMLLYNELQKLYNFKVGKLENEDTIAALYQEDKMYKYADLCRKNIEDYDKCCGIKPLYKMADDMEEIIKDLQDLKILKDDMLKTPLLKSAINLKIAYENLYGKGGAELYSQFWQDEFKKRRLAHNDNTKIRQQQIQTIKKNNTDKTKENEQICMIRLEYGFNCNNYFTEAKDAMDNIIGYREAYIKALKDVSQQINKKIFKSKDLLKLLDLLDKFNETVQNVSDVESRLDEKLKAVRLSKDEYYLAEGLFNDKRVSTSGIVNQICNYNNKYNNKFGAAAPNLSFSVYWKSIDKTILGLMEEACDDPMIYDHQEVKKFEQQYKEAIANVISSKTSVFDKMFMAYGHVHSYIQNCKDFLQKTCPDPECIMQFSDLVQTKVIQNEIESVRQYLNEHGMQNDQNLKGTEQASDDHSQVESEDMSTAYSESEQSPSNQTKLLETLPPSAGIAVKKFPTAVALNTVPETPLPR